MEKCREALLLRLSAAQFAAWEMHVFLDTHPSNKEALALRDKYVRECAQLKREYEEKYGLLTFQSGSPNQWLANPWPWDYEED
jgi:spore coat protein JB